MQGIHLQVFKNRIVTLKNSASRPQVKLYQPLTTLCLVAPDSDFSQFLEEIDELYEFFPEIKAAIERDLHADAIEEKKLRMADQKFEQQRTPDLLNINVDTRLGSDQKIELEVGRPRMATYLVYLFLMIRGYWGSVTSKKALTLLRESKSLHLLLENRQMTMPGPTSILENINCVSKSTHDLILDCQIHKAFAEELDEFQELTGDSTAVHANSAWPTDATMLHGIINRVYQFSQKLDRFKLPNFNKSRMPAWLAEMDSLTFTINLAAGKANSKKNLKKHYRTLLKKGAQAIAHLAREYAALTDRHAPYSHLKPSKRVYLERVLQRINEDLADALRVLHYTQDRVFKEIQLKSTEKVLSLSDEAAAYIKKGSRNPIIGYKPQLMRSAKGFVCSLIVDEGNVSDAVNLVPLALDSISRTSVIPDSLSVDDGYSSRAGAQTLRDMGIKTVSISGAKGKKITPEADWNSLEYQIARANRSAVESLMFTIKYSFNFGQLRRTGLEQVRCELFGKILAYNAAERDFAKAA